jgi:hypothetical protein
LWWIRALWWIWTWCIRWWISVWDCEFKLKIIKCQWWTYGELDLYPGEFVKGEGPGGLEFWFIIVVVLDDPGGWWDCDVTITGAE